MTSPRPLTAPQAKICGLTVPAEASAIAALGASAIGLVFYPPSPRNVSLDQAGEIQHALPAHVPAVGVFVDPDWEFLCRAVETAGLGGIQLHGNESPDLVDRLCRTFDIPVIKGLFAARPPAMTDAGQYAPNAFLVEAGKGVLPGGNAETWDWATAAPFIRSHRTILAGGLDPENVAQAVAACLPDAVDASSGLESAPGRKDLEKVKQFLSAVGRTAGIYFEKKKEIQRIFGI